MILPIRGEICNATESNCLCAYDDDFSMFVLFFVAIRAVVVFLSLIYLWTLSKISVLFSRTVFFVSFLFLCIFCVFQFALQKLQTKYGNEPFRIMVIDFFFICHNYYRVIQAYYTKHSIGTWCLPRSMRANVTKYMLHIALIVTSHFSSNWKYEKDREKQRRRTAYRN